MKTSALRSRAARISIGREGAGPSGPDGADDGAPLQPDREEDAIDEALRETFPASDPIAVRIG